MNLIKTGIAVSAFHFFLSSLAHADVRNAPNQPTYHSQADRPHRITVRHIEPQGIGYNQGYTTLEGFFSLYNGSCDWVPFLDVRAHIFNNGKPAINAGLGTRYLTNRRVWGINSYYDYRNTNRQHYNQVAMGLESGVRNGY